MKTQKKYSPLISFFLSQPNAYSSVQQFSSHSHISCFDFSVKLGDPTKNPLSCAPTIDNYAIDLVQTRPGNPDHVTGIPPAFFNLKCLKEHGKNTNYTVEISRPTQISISTTKLEFLLSLKEKIIDIWGSNSKEKPARVKSTFLNTKSQFRGVDMVQLKTEQIVLVLESDDLEARLALGQFKKRIFICDRPEKIHSFFNLASVTFSFTYKNMTRLVLTPWTASLDINVFLEAWQSHDSDPLVHFALDSDCIMLNISPETIVCTEKIVRQWSDFLTGITSANQNDSAHFLMDSMAHQDKDQHYKDDLRAGAFQFVEAGSKTGDELPLPYQVCCIKHFNSR